MKMKLTNLIALLLSISLAVNAQQITLTATQNPELASVLSGRIFDPNGAVVPQIKVLIRGRKQTYQTVTNEEGVYKIELPPGIYNKPVA